MNSKEWIDVLPAQAMAVQVSRLLEAPPTPADSVATLRRADAVFGILDGLMRSGAPLPAFWPADSGTYGHENATELYDAVSTALRETGGSAACYLALREASQKWKALDSELADGSALPEPWQRP